MLPSTANLDLSCLDRSLRFTLFWGREFIPGFQRLLQRLAGVRPTAIGHRFGRACDDDFTAARASFGADVDNPVGRFDHIQVVLNDQDRVARFDKILQDIQQQLDVGKVQSRGGLVQQVKRLARAAFHQFACQLDPLGLAPGKRWRRLPNFQIIQPDTVQRFQLVQNDGHVFKELHRLLDVHVQDIGD